MTHLEKFTVLEPVHDRKRMQVIRVLTDLINLFKVPTRIISDRETGFASRTFKLFCGAYEAKHKQVQSALNTSFNKCISSTPIKALIGYNSK